MNISVTLERKGISGLKVANVENYLKQMAQIVKLDIQDHIEDSEQITGGAMAGLAQSTIEHKRSPHEIDNPGEAAMLAGSLKPKRKNAKAVRLFVSKFPTKPLIDGGNLLKNQTIEKVSDKEYIIKVGSQRKEIAAKMQRSRPFFGISEKALTKIRNTVFGKSFLIK